MSREIDGLLSMIKGRTAEHYYKDLKRKFRYICYLEDKKIICFRKINREIFYFKSLKEDIDWLYDCAGEVCRCIDGIDLKHINPRKDILTDEQYVMDKYNYAYNKTRRNLLMHYNNFKKDKDLINE
tara:strand:+ start:342 stop:719 length:378 start_codon:yes stop_codon:yes gene_type:complete